MKQISQVLFTWHQIDVMMQLTPLSPVFSGPSLARTAVQLKWQGDLIFLIPSLHLEVATRKVSFIPPHPEEHKTDILG